MIASHTPGVALASPPPAREREVGGGSGRMVGWLRGGGVLVLTGSLEEVRRAACTVRLHCSHLSRQNASYILSEKAGFF